VIPTPTLTGLTPSFGTRVTGLSAIGVAIATTINNTSLSPVMTVRTGKSNGLDNTGRADSLLTI